MLIKVVDLNKDSTIAQYVENRTIDAIIGCTGINVYDDFIEFCNDNNIQTTLTNTSFRARLLRQHNLTTKIIKINNKSVRVIIKK